MRAHARERRAHSTRTARSPSLYLLVDDLNTVFLIIGTLVGFTTSVFSAGYIAHELQARKLRSRDLRFYHAMYQFLMFAMDLALVSNNIGLMWVAIELATLTTVVMVGIYRTNAALEASWKYFISGLGRHRPRPLRHDPCIPRRAGTPGRGHAGHGLGPTRGALSEL